MNDDAAQLEHYAKSHEEDSFAAIVQRYLPLVYAAALRRVGGDAHRAEDVAQMVFIAVARNAASLAHHPDLTGWLFTTTRFLAAKAVRSERRRQTREQQSSVADPMTPTDSRAEAPAELHAMLDDVLMELKQIDRQIVLLRFHRGLRLAEIGAQLAVTENAVQKRLDRALDQLRKKLTRRGVTSTAAAVAIALEQQSAVALPSGLTAAATTAALAGGAGIGGLAVMSSFMIVSKLQIGLAAAVVVATSAGLVWQARENTQLRADAAQQTAAVDASIADLQRQIAAQSQRASAAEADATALRKAMPTARPEARALTDIVDRWKASMDRASQLRGQGKLQEALDEYLNCYRFLRGKRTHPPADNQIVMSSIKWLGKDYPPAIDALRALRDQAMQDFQRRPGSRELVEEIAFLNDRLGEGGHTVALYDLLSLDDHAGRQAVASIGHNAFVEARRYNDALVGKTFGSMMNELDMGTRSAARETGMSLTNHKAFVIGGTVSNIEVLTGAGKLDEARVLTEKLLAFDHSDATSAAIKQHVERATQSPAR